MYFVVLSFKIQPKKESKTIVLDSFFGFVILFI